eukprot:1759916-Rhodomonas_salina.1
MAVAEPLASTGRSTERVRCEIKAKSPHSADKTGLRGRMQGSSKGVGGVPSQRFRHRAILPVLVAPYAMSVPGTP